MERNRNDIVAAAFAAAEQGAAFDPIRVQKLLFLIDREVSDRIGGPFFKFLPYHYGPFDAAVYDAIEEMAAAGTARIDESGPCPRYQLTEAGRERGDAVLASFDPPISDYFERTARWVRLMPYRRMLEAIHRQYPEMAVNSWFRNPGEERPLRRRNPFIRGMASAFDFTGTMFSSPDSVIGLESDRDAIRDIWRSVGDDLEEAMVGFGESERLW